MKPFQYTDEQLNFLNRGYNVYSVNKDFVNRKIKEGRIYQYIVDKPNDKLLSNESNTIRMADNQQFKVIKTYSDPETGFDGMAVAPIVDGEIDYASVAVIAAATDNKTIDTKTALLGEGDIKKNHGYYLSEQYTPAEKFVQSVIDDPRVQEVTQLSGYSQSAYMMKVGAKFGIPTTTFNAWFHYGSLSKEEKDYIRSHPGLFVDYRKNKDVVVWLTDGNHPQMAGYDESLGTIYWTDGLSHNVEDWEFDEETGRVLDAKTGKPIISAPAYVFAQSARQMLQFTSLKSKWQQTGGGLSSAETIFLDAGQSAIVGSSMAKVAKAGLEEMASLKAKMDSEVEALWGSIDFSAYSHLSYWEVQDIFASQGVTYESIVGDFQAYTQEKVQQMEDLSTTFDTLNTRLTHHVEESLALDYQLAGEFKTWYKGL
ncbi:MULTISPECIES: hypothetical protein [unclassified Streptococcus]|uniref:hypothetical protein n=1 Tax=unclassified Streptococcus TaxID=2608887 RepID=UPI001072CCDF|nr:MULTISPECIES: hypothetical protein [unclassified Streptococcus]MBF0775496.1 hypothetical protein [Streptococcus sp. 19428wD3_AN2]TFU84655.1 hypothetical protein E4T83_01715 [Streptococcus sp. AN2]